MSHRSPRIPSYRLHKQSGQAIVTLPDGVGGRNDVLLGKYDTPESRAEYVRVVAEWEARGRRAARSKKSPDVSVNEMLLAYWRFVVDYYRHFDGTATSEVNNIKQALRPLRILYGRARAAAFDSVALETLRAQLVGQGLGRKRINKDVARVKRAFKWAVGKKLVPLAVFQELQTVEGLRAGRSAARETEPVKPVPEEHVYATLPRMLRPVAAMVQLQLLAGMRPGEVILMRPCDLDRSSKVWTYRPGSGQGPHGRHKTAWRGHSKVILIGPRGQEIIRPFLFKPAIGADQAAGEQPAIRGPEEFLFSPAEGMAELWDLQRRQRKTKNRSKAPARRKAPLRQAGSRYRVSSYSTAVARACKKANVPHWHPNQLRHTKATEIRREAGLDAARVVLGHRSPAVTEVYAELDQGKAAEVMERLG